MKQPTPAGVATVSTPKRGPPMLTPRQETFCTAYLGTGNASEAYRQAYPKSKSWQPTSVFPKASALLKNGKVLARLEELRDSTAAPTIMEYSEALEAATAVVRDPDTATRDRLAAIALLAKLRGWEAPAKLDVAALAAIRHEGVVTYEEGGPDLEALRTGLCEALAIVRARGAGPQRAD